MKYKHCIHLILFFAITSLIGSFGVCQTSEHPMDKETHKLSGHTLKAEDLVSKSDFIFIGKITSLGIASLKAEGQAKYWSVSVTVEQNLKNSVDPTAKFSLTVKHDVNESAPQLNTEYIFFVKSESPSLLQILKIEEATPERVSKVRKLIAQQAN